MSVKFQDYYKTLGVERTASQTEITKGFRKLARKYHPDINKTQAGEKKFKQINEAYEVLSDEGNRKKYDSLGANWKNGQNFQPPPGFEGFNFGQNGGGGFNMNDLGGGFSDFFSAMFGGGDPRSQFQQGMGGNGHGMRQPRKGEDVKADLSITLDDAYHNRKKEITLKTRNPDGSIESQKYQVKIPVGITSGKVIRLKGQGNKGSLGGPDGDLLLKIHIAPDSRFKIDGSKLITAIALAPWEAALGAKVKVPTLDGRITLSIPPGTSSGTKMRLREKGLPQATGKNGDIHVEIKIATPKKLSQQEKELFEQLQQASTFNPRN